MEPSDAEKQLAVAMRELEENFQSAKKLFGSLLLDRSGVDRRIRDLIPRLGGLAPGNSDQAVADGRIALQQVRDPRLEVELASLQETFKHLDRCMQQLVSWIKVAEMKLEALRTSTRSLALDFHVARLEAGCQELELLRSSIPTESIPREEAHRRAQELVFAATTLVRYFGDNAEIEIKTLLKDPEPTA